MNNAVLTLLLSLYVYSEGDIKSAFKVSTTRVHSDRRVDTRVVEGGGEVAPGRAPALVCAVVASTVSPNSRRNSTVVK